MGATVLQTPSVETRSERDPFGRLFLGADERWRVLHTRSRQEKALGETLDAAGITYFLPVIRKEMRYAHRRRVSEIPLFASYVFLWGPIDAAYFAVASKRVARIIDVPDQAAFERQITQIQRALLGGATLDPYPYLNVGKRVSVRTGPLRGLEGLVEQRRGLHRLVLRVDVLGQATSLEIDGGILDPLD